MKNTYQKPIRFFEEQGVVSPKNSYFVSLEKVTNTKNQDIKTMVNLGRFFTIFAPRQSGKTTFFYDFCRSIENDPLYITILLSFQTCHNLNETQFYGKLNKDIKRHLLNRLKAIQCKDHDAVQNCIQKNPISNHLSFYELFEKLNEIISHKKIVIFIDEFDGIPLKELENFLMVLRDLYQNYKDISQKALYSVGLVGIRNIAKLIVGGVSPFNIADQVRLPMFSLKNVHDLYAQYSQETNQPFLEEAVKKIYNDTGGQPWLVNRLGNILTCQIKPDTIDPIKAIDVDNAISHLLVEKNSHFDNLLSKIRVHQKIFNYIAHNDVNYDPDNSEQSYLEQYGLIKNKEHKARVFNKIYEQRFCRYKSVFNNNKEPLIFLCYAKEDILTVKSLYHNLKQEGLNPWLDIIDILPGQNWKLEIQRAINASSFALICLSQMSVQKKGFLNKEIKWALDRQAEMPEGNIFLIPVKIEDCELNQQFVNIQAVELLKADGYERLIEAVKFQLNNNGDRQS